MPHLIEFYPPPPQELPFGGWVAPNIYYLGYAGVVRVNGVRIGGMSGIYKAASHLKGRFEKPPYNPSTARTVYHTRNVDTFRLKQLADNPPDIMLSHDWPRGVHQFGNVNELLRRKPFFKEDLENGVLGSKPAAEVLRTLGPRYWFSAHLHTKFAALLPFTGDGSDDGDDNIDCGNKGGADDGSGRRRSTRFLALDKCLPKRDFLQILDIEEGVGSLPGEERDPAATTVPDLYHDPEWLAILRSTDHLQATDAVDHFMPGRGGAASERWDFRPTAQEVEEVEKLFNRDLRIDPAGFRRTLEPFDPARDSVKDAWAAPKARPVKNEQTRRLCSILGIADPLQKLCGEFEEPPRGHQAVGDHEDGDVGRFGSDDHSSSMVQDKDDEDDDEVPGPAANPAQFGRLSLPAPIHVKQEDLGLAEDGPEADVAGDHKSEGSMMDTSCPTKGSRPSSPLPDGENSAGKKVIKRRNQSIYTDDD